MMVDPPCDSLFHVCPGALRGAAADSLFPGWNRPVDPPVTAHSTHLDHAPFQQGGGADPPDRPCFRGIPRHVRMMNPDAQKLRHCGLSRVEPMCERRISKVDHTAGPCNRPPVV